MAYKVRIQQADTTWITASVNPTDLLQPHFSFKEVSNPSCKETIKLELGLKAQRFWSMMESTRVWYNKKMPVNSGYRSPSYNKQVGGIDTSLHLIACAADIQLGAISDAEYKKILKHWEQECKANKVHGELGRYPWGLHFGAFQEYNTNVWVYEFDER